MISTVILFPHSRMEPIHQRIIAINKEESERYVASEAERLRYWAKHPTFFACIKCMDGRVSIPLMTKTPIGIVKPFRAIGGKFDIWWPTFLGRISHWTDRAISQGSRTFVFVSYHYSASDIHLGCAGWKYDTKAARNHAEYLKKELEFVFGEEITAMTTGVETDHDLLTLHGPNGDLSGEMLIGKSDQDIQDMIARHFPMMSQEMIRDLVPFLRGNAERISELRKYPRKPEQLEHNERIIAIGQGFDWLVEENLALIINDADPNLAESIRVAGSLIEKNLRNAPAGDDATIFTNIQYRKSGMDKRQAIARARGLRLFAEKVLHDAYPELMRSGRCHSLSSIMWEPSKEIHIIT